MKRIASLLLVFVMVLSMIPVSVQAAEIDGEDFLLDYGTSGAGAQSVALMSTAAEQTFEMADIPAGGSYQKLTASQEMIDVIKDFEGFRS